MLFTPSPNFDLGFGQGVQKVPYQEDAGSSISSDDSDPNPFSPGGR